MKVNGFRELIQVVRPLKPQTEGGDGNGGPGHEQEQRQQQQHQAADNGELSAASGLMTEEQERMAVEKAVQDFEKEAQSQQHGLHASITPGLRVVLSDVNGNVIRQLGAQEFLKLRQIGSGDSRGRGKLLDQKY